MIGAWVEQLLLDLPSQHAGLAGLASPYGDGTSARRSVAAITVMLAQPPGTRRPGIGHG